MSDTADTAAPFAERLSVAQIEESTELAPKFDAQGLIPAIATDAATGEVLMHGFMDKQALQLSIETGQAHYYSRSRQKLWHKGATSGLVQEIVELRIDDDQDCVWMQVKVAGNGASCHVGYRSCFYRSIPVGKTVAPDLKLHFEELEKTFDPVKVYGNTPNPTKI
ncbi:MAG: phosphoribosyl-AMP cyclohydrolase [Alphaproteobacteria bacterium]|nr:phosphoribosyl-AMP cyclohydrolase [Alphaproteobacteria bacterium]